MSDSQIFHIELVDDKYTPALRIKFPRGAKLPRTFVPLKYRGTARDGQPLPPKNRTYLEWARSLPQRKFEVRTGAWLVTSPGPEYRRVFRELGFAIDDLPSELLDEYDQPLIELEPEYDYLTYVHPRFADWYELSEHLPEIVLWGESSLRVYTPDFHFHPPSKALSIPAGIRKVARDLASKGMPGVQIEKQFISQESVEATSIILSGHTFLADAPGNGRRIKALNAQVARKAKRLIVVCRREEVKLWMVAVTVANREELSEKQSAWFRDEEKFQTLVRELKASGLYESLVAGNEKVLNLLARPVADIPDHVVAVVCDVDTLIENPDTSLALRAWQADGLIVDDAQDFTTWVSARTAQVRWLSSTVDGLRIPIADATRFSDPVQVMPLLAISGHLDPVFGGMTTYCTTVAEIKRNGWVTRRDKLQWLVNALNENVWLRSASAAEIQFDEGF